VTSVGGIFGVLGGVVILVGRRRGRVADWQSISPPPWTSVSAVLWID
jgi:hypothetical protein